MEDDNSTTSALLSYPFFWLRYCDESKYCWLNPKLAQFSHLHIDNIGVDAQVIPDGTLNTTVTGSNNYSVTNGSRVGNNLFHSFSQFSLPRNGSAVFNNATDIQNIFSRVTGGNVSHVDGLIQANGSANLFLLNPRGIIFGQNARFNIRWFLCGDDSQ